MRRTIGGLLLAALLMPTVAFAEGANFVGVGAGIVFSSGYHDAMEAHYGDRFNGGSGWFDGDLSLGFGVRPGLQVGPRVRMLGNTLKYENSYGLPASEDANLMYTGGVFGRYEFMRKENTPFAELELAGVGSSLIVESDEPHAPVFGMAVGFAIPRAEFALTYLSIPTRSVPEDRNFGGMGFTIKTLWHFGS